MTLFSNRFVAEFADLLTTALLHFVWQGAILTLMLIVIVKWLDVRNAKRRYLLSVGTLLMMAMAPFLTIALRHNGKGIPQDSAASSHSSPVIALESIDANWQEVLGTQWNHRIEVCVLVAWLAGVLILSTRLAVGFGITLWIRANVKPLSDQFEQRVQILGGRLRINARNRVFASIRVGQAVAVGFLRPIVLIPVAWLTQLTPEMLEAVIAHELAHIRRWDLLVNLVQRFIETLLFYHPAVWWLSHRIRLEREMCCDEIAADCLDRAVYVRSLESVARIARGNLLLAASIHGETQMNLLNRIRHLLGTAPDDIGNWRTAGFVAMVLPLMAVAVISITAGSTPSSAIADEKKPIEVNENAAHANGTTIDVTDSNVEVGQGISVRMTGDVAKEYYRLVVPEHKFKPEYDVFVIGKVTALLPDGRFRIEKTLPVEGKNQKLQQISMTIFAQQSQIKNHPKRADDDVFVFADIDGKQVAAKLVTEGGGKAQLIVQDGKNKSEKAAPVKTIPVQAGVQTFDRKYAEVSDLMSVTFKLWELKEQVGK